MKATPSMIDAAVSAANEHGLAGAASMPAAQFHDALTKSIQAALDADPFLARAERFVFAGADLTQLQKFGSEDMDNIVANCNIRMFTPSHHK